MKFTNLFKVGLSLLGLALITGLGVDDTAPDFELQGSDGKTYKLSDLLAEQAVVLAWYPKAFTSGCTVECKSLVEKGDLIREFDVAYFMVSVDPLDDVTRFAKSLAADFPLLADPNKAVAEQYGVISNWGFAKRQNIYINMSGKVIGIDEKVNPETAAEDIAARLSELGIAKRAS